MQTPNLFRPARRFFAVLTLLACAGNASAQAPDFDTVAWTPLSCSAGDPASDETPSAVDLVGDASYLASYYAHDASFLYVRYRVDADPAGPGGFASYTWATLVQVPSGNPFQYQYELSLDGKAENVEIWANTSAQNIDFSPLFNDPSEVRLFTTPAATAPLARHGVATDGSSFGGNPDYFVDVAFPVSALVDAGIITTAADLDAVLFFPATSANPNNYNKGYLNCPFTPGATLSIDKSVAPSTVPANAVTPIAYTIAVRNDGVNEARGLVIEDPSLPGYLSNVVVSVGADDLGVSWSVVDTQPLEVRVPTLPPGKTVTVTIAADASPDCGDPSFTNVATAFATNAASVSGSTLLSLNLAAGGCAPCTQDADCDDSNACTADACVAGTCIATSDPTCTPCAVDGNCADDGNPCTTQHCSAGTCVTTTDPACTVCGTEAECDDANPCTTDSCTGGVCTTTPDPTCGHGGGACSTDADCDDGDACTTDACVAGACVATAIADCRIESCSNGLDDDGDGLVDCHDTDCAGAPGCESVEVCGDCIDNDGDGLVDYQDPDCCGAPAALDVRRLMLCPAPKNKNAKRLRLKVRDTGFAASTLDPMHADTTLQLSDPAGTIVCQRIPASAWTHRRPRSFRFKDKTGTVAGGVKTARFAMKRTGPVPFQTIGKSMTLGTTLGHHVTVTVGVGEQCSSATTQMRAKRDRMVFP